MAGQGVHDKTGKTCWMCATPFTKSSLNLTVSVKEPGFIVKHCVCGSCYHEFMSKGE